MNKEDSIKISPKPFIFIALFFITAVSFGSVMNYFRMKNRFDSLVDHSKVIYQAHLTEIDSLFKKEENITDVKNVLNNINSPEKGIYFVDIIRNIDGKWILYDDQASNIEKLTVSQTNIDLIQKYSNLSHNEKFSFQKNLKNFYDNFYKYRYYNEDFLFSVLPIKQVDNVVGYFVVTTPKVQRN